MNDEAAAGSVPPISADPPPSAVVASPAAAGSTARGAERGARVPSSGRCARATRPARTAGRQRGRRMTRAQAPPKTGAPTLSASEANRPPVPPPHLTTEFVHPTGRISARPLTRSSSIRTRVLRAASAGVGEKWTNPGWSTERNNQSRPRTEGRDRWNERHTCRRWSSDRARLPDDGCAVPRGGLRLPGRPSQRAPVGAQLPRGREDVRRPDRKGHDLPREEGHGPARLGDRRVRAPGAFRQSRQGARNGLRLGLSLRRQERRHAGVWEAVDAATRSDAWARAADAPEDEARARQAARRSATRHRDAGLSTATILPARSSGEALRRSRLSPCGVPRG